MAWVYIVECADGRLYAGSTRNIEQRIDQHNTGKGSGFTSGRHPVRLVYAYEFERVVDAWEAERRLHGWGRAKRKALIEGRIDLLKVLAKRPGARRNSSRPGPDPGSC